MAAAELLAPGVWRVPTAPWDLVNSFLIRRVADGPVTLVDTGIKNAPARVLAALEEIGSAPSEVTEIVLTHAHSDHAGGAAELASITGSGITAHVDEAEYVRTGTTPPRDPSFRLGKLLGRVPGNAAAPVAREMVDGELLDCGLRVHHTPGHSPGHCSLLHEETGVLITGDAIWNMRSRRTWPVLAFCTNAAVSQATAATLGGLTYTTAAFTHGPAIQETGRQAIGEFLAHPRRFGPGL